MYILDTNVVSENMAAVPSDAVVSWLRARSPDLLFATAVTKAELLFGVRRLPTGRRREDLEMLIAGFFTISLRTEILGFGSREAEMYADLVAHRWSIGRPISQSDAQIASIARARGFVIVTRNVRDFEHCGIEVINPWEQRA